MLRRLPVVPTVLVLLAVGVMLRLGFWQLDRMHEKAAMLARYNTAQAVSADVAWPRTPAEVEAALFRHTSVTCTEVTDLVAMAGTSAKGEAGIGHQATCRLADGGAAHVVLGWSRDPAARDWRGGEVAGLIAPGGKQGPRLIADPPLAGLEASARPDPATIPNNHWSYAVQWFLFAATALVIYALALRKQLNPPRNGEGDHP